MGKLSNRNYTKKYADGAQKAGGAIRKAIDFEITIKQRPAPAPSEHAVMRVKKQHGPVRGTLKYARWSTPRAARLRKGVW